MTLQFISPVYAADSPWTQTDWVEGSGQTDWSDSTKYSSSSNIDDSTAGKVTLSVNPYTDRVLAYSPIAYWPLNEASGGTAEDLSGNNYDGSYTGVDLGQTGIGDGNTAPYFDGTNDYVNIYSTGFRDVFNGAEGTVVIWAKVFNADVWTDGNVRYPTEFRVDGSNYVYAWTKFSNNSLASYYYAGG